MCKSLLDPTAISHPNQLCRKSPMLPAPNTLEEAIFPLLLVQNLPSHQNLSSRPQLLLAPVLALLLLDLDRGWLRKRKILMRMVGEQMRRKSLGHSWRRWHPHINLLKSIWHSSRVKGKNQQVLLRRNLAITIQTWSEVHTSLLAKSTLQRSDDKPKNLVILRMIAQLR